MKQTILVTGGTGFIGSHTTVELQNAGYNVVIVDNLSNSQANVVDGIEKITGIRPAFEEADCCDFAAMERIFNKYPNIEGIIHFAASKAVGESVEKPLMYYRNNFVSLINLLELMPKYNVKGIIFSSSCTVYGQPDPENLPVTEDAPIKPAESPYGNTKQVNEEIIRAELDVRVSILGYLQRGGSPTANDRILASRLGVAAIDALLEGQRNVMIGLRNNEIVYIPFTKAIKDDKPIDKETVRAQEILAS